MPEREPAREPNSSKNRTEASIAKGAPASSRRARPKKQPASSSEPREVPAPMPSGSGRSHPGHGRSERRSARDDSPVLVVTDVRILDADEHDRAVSHLELDQPFVMELQLRVKAPGAEEVESAMAPLDVEVYADPITLGPASLVAEQKVTISGGEESTAKLLVPGLPEGIYRLVTTVTGNEPVRLSGYHDGPVVSVA